MIENDVCYNFSRENGLRFVRASENYRGAFGFTTCDPLLLRRRLAKMMQVTLSLSIQVSITFKVTSIIDVLMVNVSKTVKYISDSREVIDVIRFVFYHQSDRKMFSVASPLKYSWWCTIS